MLRSLIIHNPPVRESERNLRAEDSVNRIKDCQQNKRKSMFPGCSVLHCLKQTEKASVFKNEGATKRLRKKKEKKKERKANSLSTFQCES